MKRKLKTLWSRAMLRLRWPDIRQVQVLLFFLGCGCIVGGVAMMHLPTGVIVAGVILLVCAFSL